MPLTDIQHNFIRPNTFSVAYTNYETFGQIKKPTNRVLIWEKFKAGNWKGKMLEEETYEYIQHNWLQM